MLAAVACYAVIRAELRGPGRRPAHGPGRAARARSAAATARRPRFGPGGGLPGLSPRAGGAAPFAQLVGPGGEAAALRGAAPIPVTGEDRAIAAGDAGERLSDRDAGGAHLRVLTVPLPRGGGAVMLARSLAGVDDALAPAAARARLALPRGHRRSPRCSARASRTASPRCSSGSRRAQTAQRALVADASHELRTPVTALRTNAELLREDPARRPPRRCSTTSSSRPRSSLRWSPT